VAGRRTGMKEKPLPHIASRYKPHEGKNRKGRKVWRKGAQRFVFCGAFRLFAELCELFASFAVNFCLNAPGATI
jgi:hypothetical protein